MDNLEQKCSTFCQKKEHNIFNAILNATVPKVKDFSFEFVSSEIAAKNVFDPAHTNWLREIIHLEMWNQHCGWMGWQ